MIEIVTESPGWWKGITRTSLKKGLELRTDCQLAETAMGAPVIARGYRCLSVLFTGHESLYSSVPMEVHAVRRG